VSCRFCFLSAAVAVAVFIGFRPLFSRIDGRKVAATHQFFVRKTPVP